MCMPHLSDNHVTPISFPRRAHNSGNTFGFIAMTLICFGRVGEHLWNRCRRLLREFWGHVWRYAVYSKVSYVGRLLQGVCKEHICKHKMYPLIRTSISKRMHLHTYIYIHIYIYMYGRTHIHTYIMYAQVLKPSSLGA